MPRYVDISAIHIPKGFFEGLNVPKLLSWLESLPAADVREVKHGEWEMIPPSKKYPSGEYVKFRCSECGISFGGSSKYCGCCGARMDGKRLGEVSKDKNTGM